MYSNIGGKIKVLAKVIAIIEAAAAVIMGIAIMAEGDELVPIGMLIMFVGPVVAWISSWLLYGFGELIEKTCNIAQNTHGLERKPKAQPTAQPTAQPKVDYERIKKIESLRAQGLITEEEYQRASSKVKKEAMYE